MALVSSTHLYAPLAWLAFLVGVQGQTPKLPAIHSQELSLPFSETSASDTASFSCPDHYVNMTFLGETVAMETPFSNTLPAVLLGRIDVNKEGFPIAGSHLGVHFPGTDDFKDNVLLVVGQDEKTMGMSGGTMVDFLVGDLENSENILVNGVLTPLDDIDLFSSPDPNQWTDAEYV